MTRGRTATIWTSLGPAGARHAPHWPAAGIVGELLRVVAAKHRRHRWYCDRRLFVPRPVHRRLRLSLPPMREKKREHRHLHSSTAHVRAGPIWCPAAAIWSTTACCVSPDGPGISRAVSSAVWSTAAWQRCLIGARVHCCSPPHQPTFQVEDGVRRNQQHLVVTDSRYLLQCQWDRTVAFSGSPISAFYL